MKFFCFLRFISPLFFMCFCEWSSRKIPEYTKHVDIQINYKGIKPETRKVREWGWKREFFFRVIFLFLLFLFYDFLQLFFFCFSLILFWFSSLSVSLMIGVESVLFFLFLFWIAVWALCVTPNGWLCSGSDDKTIRIWDLKSNQCLTTLQGHTNYGTLFITWALIFRVLPFKYWQVFVIYVDFVYFYFVSPFFFIILFYLVL